MSHGQPALRLPLAALDPGLRGTAAQGARGKAGWPGFYRRSATGLAAYGFGRVPCNNRAQTAVARQVPRLAQGVVPLDPGLRGTAAQGARGKAGWPGFYRRSATGLAAYGFGRVPCNNRAQTAVARQVPRLAPVFGELWISSECTDRRNLNPVERKPYKSSHVSMKYSNPRRFSSASHPSGGGAERR